MYGVQCVKSIRCVDTASVRDLSERWLGIYVIIIAIDTNLSSTSKMRSASSGLRDGPGASTGSSSIAWSSSSSLTAVCVLSCPVSPLSDSSPAEVSCWPSSGLSLLRFSVLTSSPRLRFLALAGFTVREGELVAGGDIETSVDPCSPSVVVAVTELLVARAMRSIVGAAGAEALAREA